MLRNQGVAGDCNTLRWPGRGAVRSHMLWVAAAVRVQVVRPVGVPLALLLAVVSQRAEPAGGPVRRLSLDLIRSDLIRSDIINLGEAEVIVEQLAADIEQDLRGRRRDCVILPHPPLHPY